MNRVKAIRDDEEVGNGTCSYIDECWSDAELITMMDEDNIKTEAEAVDWARDTQSLQMEMERNAGWGAPDDDPNPE